MLSLLLSAVLLTLSPPRPMPLPPEPAPAVKQELVLTADSDVRLDEKPCPIADVPGDATVTTLEVAADKKTILRIYFTSKPK